jgi:hypothetical protein
MTEQIGKVLLVIVMGLVFSWSCQPAATSEEEADAAETPGIEETEAEPAEMENPLPEGALALSEVLSSLEEKGYGPFVEIEFEDGLWEVEVFRDNEIVLLEVDAISGEVVPREPLASEEPLSGLVRKLEEDGYGPFLELEQGISETGERVWEVNALRTEEVELELTGKAETEEQ